MYVNTSVIMENHLLNAKVSGVGYSFIVILECQNEQHVPSLDMTFIQATLYGNLLSRKASNAHLGADKSDCMLRS